MGWEGGRIEWEGGGLRWEGGTAASRQSSDSVAILAAFTTDLAISYDLTLNSCWRLQI